MIWIVIAVAVLGVILGAVAWFHGWSRGLYVGRQLAWDQIVLMRKDAEAAERLLIPGMPFPRPGYLAPLPEPDAFTEYDKTSKEVDAIFDEWHRQNGGE